METNRHDQMMLAITERQRIQQIRQKRENRSNAKVYALMVVAIFVTVSLAVWLAGLRTGV